MTQVDRRGAGGAAIAFVASCVLAGCAIFGGGGGGGGSIQVDLAGASNLNSCGTATGNAVTVRVYQLASPARLADASLTELWDHEGEILSGDLLDQREVVLDPGAGQVVRMSRDPKTAAVGVVANYCKAERDCWRWVSPVNGGDVTVKLLLEELCIRGPQKR